MNVRTCNLYTIPHSTCGIITVYKLVCNSVPCRLGYARITHGGLSDTELQVGRFRIPEDPSSFADNEHITTDPQEVDVDVWFNSR